jgi:hypothetical protein
MQISRFWMALPMQELRALGRDDREVGVGVVGQ